MPHSHYLLPLAPSVPQQLVNAVRDDYVRFAERGPCDNLDAYLLNRYSLDLSTEYGGSPIRNPWGKASGQLSMTAAQVAEDVTAGLGFVVLKTVIAQDERGTQSMRDWAIRESRMLPERIVGLSGEHGWTISWKGRGWWQSFDEYLQLVRDARRAAARSSTLIVPSCKYHLPASRELDWKVSEYDFTTRQLLKAWDEAIPQTSAPMPLEKDFSPTLAGSDFATAREQILAWLRRIPTLVAHSASNASDGENRLRLGLKLFNALFDDDFQLEMLRAIHSKEDQRASYYIYANRLFDPARSFDGHAGIAYGGPDLSDRNLRVMSCWQKECAADSHPPTNLPWSATGNITTGKIALEYALRGASSFQLHTFFQLPGDVYSMKLGNKPQKALHELYFHPQTGLIVWMHHLAATRGLQTNPLRFRDCIGLGT